MGFDVFNRRYAYVVLAAVLLATPSFAAGRPAAGQIVTERASLTTIDGRRIPYELGTLYVRENRSKPNSRLIGVGFARIRRAFPSGAPPTFHLPGGPGNTILDRLQNPMEAQQLLQYLAVGDVVLVEQRGYTTRGEQLVFDYQGTPQPLDQPASPDALKQYATGMATAAVSAYASRGIDLSGYTVLECADDVEELREALGYRKISLVGQSFGSQLSFAIMRRHPQIVERALLSGVEPLNNGYDMPSHVFAALQRMAWDVDQDPQMQPYLPESGLMGAVREIFDRLRTPISVQVRDPQSNRTDLVVLGVSDFQQLLSLAPEPHNIVAVYNGRYELWAHLVRNMRVNGGIARGDVAKVIPWLIDTSLGVTPFRERLLRTDPAVDVFGTWTFDLFIDTAAIWPTADVGDEFRTPVVDRTPVLFVHGDWDTSTPIENTLSILPYFPNAHALMVHRGTHGARVALERGMPDVMQRVFEFLRTGRRQQLPVSVELPYTGFSVQEPDSAAVLAQAR